VTRGVRGRVPVTLQLRAQVALRGPEKRQLTIGLTPLTDAAPIVVAHEQGFFARHGLDVTLSVEPSWANVRDKLAAGAFDAAHLLAPVALGLTLGAGPLHCPIVTALSLGANGNAITVSRALRRQMGEMAAGASLADPLEAARALARVITRDRARGAPRLRLATVFPFSMHAYTLRYWLAAAGIDPARDVELLVVPPPRMVERLAAGGIDGFCVGEPWNTLAVQRGVGSLLLPVHAIWSNAPEKVLAVRQSWAERYPSTHRALVGALLEAAAWCDAPEHRDAVAYALVRSGVLLAPLPAVLPSLRGIVLRDDGIAPPEPEPLPEFHVFHRHAASFPWRSQAAWMLVEMLRWGQIEKPLDVRAAAAAVYRCDLHREAADAVGASAPLLDEKPEGAAPAPWTTAGSLGPITMGAERFFDGAVFDPRNVVAALARHAIAHPQVRLDELASLQTP
jgi:nitrate/nitrite transport system substrate-binding protein